LILISRPAFIDLPAQESPLAITARFTHRPILEALFLLLEGGKPEFTSEF